jgi:hypothetical protein
MDTNDLLILKDAEHNLTCRQVPVDQAHAALVNRLKEYIISGFAKGGYEGFSPEIDAYYDPFSTYFYVEDQSGKLLATVRITQKTKDNILPFEQGLLRDGSSYRLDEPVKTADANSFLFSSPRALPLLFAAIARFAVKRGVEKGFCLIDISLDRFKKIYLAGGYKLSAKYAEPIYFPTFGKTVDGEFRPTYWSVLELDHAAILQHSLEAEHYQPKNLA